MKRVLSLVLSIVVAVVSCTKESKEGPYNPDGSPITQAQALEIVKDVVDEYDFVFISKTIVKNGTKFQSFDGHCGTVPRDSWVVFINTEPLANSGQFWLYIYVDSYTGNSDLDSWEWGTPDSFNYDVVKWVVPKASGSNAPVHHLTTKALSDEDSQSGNWAVIISGGVRPDMNYERYWNDCSEAYKCLRDVYNYRKDRIVVLMSDGTSSGLDRVMNNRVYTSSSQDLDGDGTNDINYSATRSNVSTVFNYLGENVGPDEQVLVFVTDHGGLINGESCIYLWNGDSITATGLADEIGKINVNSRKHVVLGQCYSGGFVGRLSSLCSNVTVATACALNELSYASDDMRYDRFLYHWISAAAGQTPEGVVVDAESNQFEGITTEEIFLYSQNKRNVMETPQYSSTPDAVGRQYGLSGEKFPYLELSGPRHISSTPGNYLYALSGLPDIYSVRWLSSESVRFTPITELTASAANVSQSPMVKNWVIAEVTTQKRTYLAKYWVSFWKPGLHMTTDLISGSIVDEYLSLPYYVEGTDVYEWFISCPDYESVRSDTYFIDFTYTGDGNPEPYYVSVRFDNPLGEETTIVRRYE